MLVQNEASDVLTYYTLAPKPVFEVCRPLSLGVRRFSVDSLSVESTVPACRLVAQRTVCRLGLDLGILGLGIDD